MGGTHLALLKHDEDYLVSRGFTYTVSEDNTGLFLVLKDYELSPEYNLQQTDVLIKIPIGYPMIGIDMFFVNPHIKLASTNMNPPATDGLIPFQGTNWQQFSRHYPWQPTYNLETHIKMVDNVLARGRWNV